MVFIVPEKVRGNDVRIVIEPNGKELTAHMPVNAYDKDTRLIAVRRPNALPVLLWSNAGVIKIQQR
ncbi:hypothetical protein [Neisseria sp.]|uniref:hypothetical protein n=1 Tax=Neisseria sp. TaxID=192066 RepID=UPI0026DD7319|nr:hypothetical protein [Neisseria sp.]MDO4906927.1 hypothetical protein [Neisseria sp.]